MNNYINTAGVIGIEAYKIEVEIDNSKNSTSDFVILGFSASNIRGSRERILKSIYSNNIDLVNKKTTINLYPNIPSKSNAFDLPIAIGMLYANGILHINDKFIKETIFIGELSLDGKVRPVKGILPIAFVHEKLGIKRIVLPKDNAIEASVIKGLEVIGVESLKECISYIKKELTIKPTIPKQFIHTVTYSLDFKDIKGHHQAKRAFQIAAAGRHNIIMVGSPGCGKTMLSKRLPTIMPPMTDLEIIQSSQIYSVSKLNNNELIMQRPFREPHHSASQVGLIGGGSYIEPGEISLAHNGILFMDEFAEFKRTALEALRQPLEGQEVTISSANQNVTYPASFLLIAALNPCPCGYHGDKNHTCKCNSLQISNYFDKISGPLLDRIDIQLSLKSVDIDSIQNKSEETSSEEMKYLVIKAFNIQMKRNGNYNGLMSVNDINKYCILTPQAEQIIKLAFEKLKMSSRSYHKIVKISRTIADLEGCDNIDVQHVKEALMYRSLGNKFKE